MDHRRVVSGVRLTEEDTAHPLACTQPHGVAGMVCAEYASPRVALCLHGRGDDFANQTTLRMLRSRIIDAFGGRQTVFTAVHTTVADRLYLDSLGVSRHIDVAAAGGCARMACLGAIAAQEDKERRRFDVVLLVVAAVPERPLRPFCFLEAQGAWSAPAGVDLIRATAANFDISGVQRACSTADVSSPLAPLLPVPSSLAWPGRTMTPALSLHPCGSPTTKLAVCLSGHARTLPRVLSFRSLQTNLIAAFGARETTVFAYIKLADAQSGVRWPGLGLKAKLDASPRVVLAALRQLGVRPEHVRLLNHSGEVALPRCNVSYVFRQQYASFRRETYDSIMGQLDNRKVCYDLVRREEMQARIRYNHVIVARPDLVWPVPVDPSCLWDLSRVLVNRDYFISVPRSMARRVLWDTYARYHSCRQLWRDGVKVAVNASIRSQEDYFEDGLRYVGVEWYYINLPISILRPSAPNATKVPGDRCVYEMATYACSTYGGDGGSRSPHDGSGSCPTKELQRSSWNELCIKTTWKNRCSQINSVSLIPPRWGVQTTAVKD